MSKSVLDVEVSFYNNYFDATSQVTINLMDFLTSDQHRTEVEQIRATDDSAIKAKLKAQLPAVTVSGVFSMRQNDKLLRHSGLICLDIDWKDNTHITNFDTLKQKLCNIKNVAYCGLSVSGKGYFVVIPIAYPAHHVQHFKELAKMFSTFGIMLDEKCADVARLRGYSYDDNPYINEMAEPYRFYALPQYSKPIRHIKNSSNSKFEKVLAEITSRHISIANDYEEWFKIGCAIATEFRESGREYYHAVCSQWNRYNHREVDKKYDNCLKSSGKITLGTFFRICQQYGIVLK